jgi:DNA-directed RNA polymerase subunit F
MSRAQIGGEESLSLTEVKRIVAAIKRRDEELNFRSQRVEDYLKSFAKRTQKDEKELRSAIEAAEVPRLKKEHVDALITFLPTTVEDFKVVMQGFSITINKENRDKLIDEIKKFA